MSFKEIKEEFNYPQVEREINEFWKKNRIFQKSIEIRRGSKAFVFYEGPPTANGLPHIGHALSRTIKDTICRYKTMKGFVVERKAGWDTQGLPVELEVEKELGFDSKEKIEEYGIVKFNQKCKESVFRYKKEWDEFTINLGFWLDLEHPYITCTNEYIESVWWSLAQFYRRGFLYKGYKILPWCPRCGTALSSHEVAQGYEEVEDPSVYVKMELIDEPGTYFFVWTTTPWTLISNVALAVHPEIEYVKIEHEGDKLILARPQAEKLFPQVVEPIESFPGTKLERLCYKPLFSFSEPDREAYYVCLADFVTTEEGTGIVHIAPAFGADDYELSKVHNLPVVQAVDERGRLTEEVTPWRGMFVKEADPLIIEDLKQRGLLFKSESYRHTYPFCWRCESPLIYYARKSWFIRTTGYKDKLLANNREVNWYPPELKEGRFGEWLEGNVDWALSRERYWGTPLNIWICEDCQAETSIESIAELKEKGSGVQEPLDLHRPFIDRVTLKCGKCSGVMRRTPEVIDAWFDSGAMPHAQYHYPFESKEEFKDRFPADFISEAIDQTRGWFYSLLAISAFLFDQPAFRNVIVNELVQDKEGFKMSKSKGNVIDPREILSQYGADAARWYIVTTSQVWLPTRFDPEGVTEVARRFLGTLKNTYSFFALYANIDKFDPKARRLEISERPLLDRWLISRLNSTLVSADENLTNYQITRACRLLQDFLIEDLSNWYVRRSRRRFWGAEESPDKLSAYLTLYEVLGAFVKAVAPVVPFVAEELYRELVAKQDPQAPESAHLCDYPHGREELIDKKLEWRMATARKVISLGLAARKSAQLKVRQPLRKISVILPPDVDPGLLDGLLYLLTEEVNVKEVSFLKDASSLKRLVAKPIFKNLGPRFGKKANAVAEVIRELSAEKVEALRAGGSLKLFVEGREESIEASEVEIEEVTRTGYVGASENGYRVYLCTELDDELRGEGFAREVVNKVQNMRKKAGFNVSDRIVLGIETTPLLRKAVEGFSDYIARETLSEKIQFKTEEDAFSQRWNINGEKAAISVRRVST
jgi:isoleucyl-tRNA synthetase